MTDWKRKLTSRKFWLSLIGFATAMLVTFGVSDLTIEKIAGLITAFGSLLAYIFAEAYVDGRREDGFIYVNGDENNDNK